jgi:hypothetical protein
MVMSNDLISRKSVLDYIEKEISTARSTETISYLRALSVHINEYEPTAFDVDKVVEELEGELRYISLIEGLNYMEFKEAIDVVKAGGIDER